MPEVALVPKMPDLMEQINPVVSEAHALVVATQDDVVTARSMGKGINALISTVEATFKPIKQAQDAAKKVTLEQEKKHLAPLQEAKGIIAGKITSWDEAERKRIEEEERIRAQEEERQRQAALTAARKKLDSLMETSVTLEEELSKLADELDKPDVTDTVAEMIRARMRTIQTKLDTNIERAQAVEQKVEEAAQPVAPVQSAASVKTATGVSQEKVITNINTKALLRYLASEDCPFDAAQFIDWKEGALKKVVNSGANLAGISWKFQAKTRF